MIVDEWIDYPILLMDDCFVWCCFRDCVSRNYIWFVFNVWCWIVDCSGDDDNEFQEEDLEKKMEHEHLVAAVVVAVNVIACGCSGAAATATATATAVVEWDDVFDPYNSCWRWQRRPWQWTALFLLLFVAVLVAVAIVVPVQVTYCATSQSFGRQTQNRRRKPEKTLRIPNDMILL